MKLSKPGIKRGRKRLFKIQNLCKDEMRFGKGLCRTKIDRVILGTGCAASERAVQFCELTVQRKNGPCSFGSGLCSVGNRLCGIKTPDRPDRPGDRPTGVRALWINCGGDYDYRRFGLSIESRYVAGKKSIAVCFS